MSDNITRILVPVDFSAHAQRACDYALTLAHRLAAAVTLLHVVDDSYVTSAWTSEIDVPNVVEVLAALSDGAEQQLSTLKRAAATRGVSIDTAVITGRPSETIVHFAVDGGFDLIVMGTHGRTGLSHVVMGSVAERVIRKAPCPVLTLRDGVTVAGAGSAAA